MAQDYGYMDGYLKKNFSNSDEYQLQKPMQQADLSPMQASPVASDVGGFDKNKAAQAAARGAGGGLGTMALSAGVATMNPYLIAGGVGLSALEGNARAKQAEEEAQAIEAQQRKQNQLSAINNLISVSKGLSVG